jgi:hypothetical protein
VLLLWLTLPRYQGAAQLYRRFVHPYLERYEVAIDGGIEHAQAHAGRHVRRVTAGLATEVHTPFLLHCKALLFKMITLLNTLLNKFANACYCTKSNGH